MPIHIIHSNMSSSNYPKSKPSRVAKISVRPIWRRKLETCHNPTNDVVQTHNQSSIPNPSSPYDQSQNLNPNLIHTQPTNASLKTLTTLGTSTSPSSSTHDYPSSQTSPPPRVSPPPPTNSHATPMLHVQTSIPHNNNTLPSSPSSEHLKFIEELKEAHELSALLALHLAQRNLDQPPSSSPTSPHNKNQVEKHVNNCPCCIFLQQQTIALNEHFTWIEYLLTRSNPISPLEQYQNLHPSWSNPNSPPQMSPPSPSPTSTHLNIYLH